MLQGETGLNPTPGIRSSLFRELGPGPSRGSGNIAQHYIDQVYFFPIMPLQFPGHSFFFPFFSSVIIICNSVYIFTFNCYVQFHFWEGVGGQELFVPFGMSVLWQFQLARAYMYALCVTGAVNTQGFYALYINFPSFIHSNRNVSQPGKQRTPSPA